MYLQEIDNLDEIITDYDAVICDIWGVLHNGVSLYQQAIAALRRSRTKGKKVILLTNAPKCSDIIQKRFAKMGASDIFWDDTVTSGDTVNAYLHHFAQGKKVFHWGTDADKGLYENHDVDFATTIDDAGIVVCTGLLYGTAEISSQEVVLLQQAFEKNLPFLCANPDKTVKIGDGYEFCAGALADIYMQLGGAVEFFGKPYPAVYQRCFDLFKNIDQTLKTNQFGYAIVFPNSAKQKGEDDYIGQIFNK